MKINDAWTNYYAHSGTTSSNVRKLAFTGIALVWLFSGGGIANTEEITISGDLSWPLYLLVLALAADFLQYVVLTAVWHRFARKMEKDDSVTSESNFEAPPKINRAGEVFFYSKVAIVAVGYGWLLITLGQRLL